MTEEIDRLPSLANSPVPAQSAVMDTLSCLYADTKSLPAVLEELERWSRKAGYFDHITQPNEYLSFPDEDLGVDLRLQINYSRLSYKQNPGQRAIACHLCYENIGSPGKELLRAFEFTAAGTPYFAHLTPFPLHRGHFVMNTRAHEPMRIGKAAISEAADFARRAPGWLAASNSDVEWAGASILGHHHCQILRDTSLPIEGATVTESAGFGSVTASVLRWPGPVMRLEGAHDRVVDLASSVIANWKSLSPGANTVNFLIRSAEGVGLTAHLILRNPAYRTAPPVTSIKSEGVGVIEVAGEIIVPPIANKSRGDNILYFQENGLGVCRDIIGMNTPPSEEWPAGRLLSLLKG